VEEKKGVCFMANTKFEKILEEVKALSADEQRQLRELLDTLVASSHAQRTEDEFEQKLLQVGLLSEVKPPITDSSSYQGRRPVETKGKPLSEIIIEERR
jgi:hypothetical protein